MKNRKTNLKFNWDGPGVFGFNACAKCHTKVDINGLDLNNRKHFEADGGCAGFAPAEARAYRLAFCAFINRFLSETHFSKLLRNRRGFGVFIDRFLLEADYSKILREFL